MLRLSIHAGPLSSISRFNRLDWLEIGYQQLAAEADYKVVLFEVGSGARPQVILAKYPRWSASVWDLVARAIAIAFSVDPKKPLETVPNVECNPERFAFADCVSAVIQHIPNAGTAIRQLGAVEIIGDEFDRGFYGATVEEELLAALRPSPFFFAPKFLRPCDLVLRGLLQALTGDTAEMPVRPPLFQVAPEIIGGEKVALFERIPEPARSGFRRWLRQRKAKPREKPFDSGAEAVAFVLFDEFLSRAI